MICQNRSGPSGAILWGTYFSMDLQLFLVLLLIVLPPQHMLLFLLLIKLILLCTCLMFLLLPSHLLLLLLILVFLLLLSPPPSRPLLPRVSIPPSLLRVCLSLSLSLSLYLSFSLYLQVYPLHSLHRYRHPPLSFASPYFAKQITFRTDPCYPASDESHAKANPAPSGCPAIRSTGRPCPTAVRPSARPAVA